MRQEILLTLRRHGPLRLTGIANKTSRSGSGISYQLERMEKEGLVVCSAEKYYRLADTKEMEKAVLEVARKKTLTAEEILQSEELRSFDAEKIKAVLDKMIITGLLEKVEELSAEKGLLQTMEKGYKLSFHGCRELGVCYFCNEPIGEGLAVEGIVSEQTWLTMDYGLCLHPACVANWMQHELGQEADYYSQVTCCDFCGLPVNARDLIGLLGYRNGIEFSKMIHCLSPEEDQALSSRAEDKEWEVLWEESFKKKLIEDRTDIDEIVAKIVEKAKQAKIQLEDYDQQKRTNELWEIAQNLIEQEQSRWDILLSLCGPMLEPISVIYSKLPTSWAGKLKRYEIITSKSTQSGEEREEMTPVSFLEGAHAPVMVQGGKRYHLYCYRLALDFGTIKSGAPC